MHIDKRDDGSTLFTPVDPQHELMLVQRDAQGQAIMDTIGDGMIRTRARVFGITFIINRPDVSSKIQR